MNTVPRRPGGETIEPPKREKLKHQDAIEITEKMPKGQAAFAQGWNEMRERLIEIGEMERSP